MGGRVALKAVIFDYGMVLTDGQNAQEHAELMRLTGLEKEKFEPLYWARRSEYDLGELTGLEFWRDFLDRAGSEPDEALAAELNQVDARMWTSINPAMLDWQAALKQRGLKTAILSNMGDNVLERMRRIFPWLERFDVLVWSFELNLAKPDAAIYRHTLDRLGVEAEEALFVDDREENTEAAAKLGMRTVLFSTVARLREQLTEAGLDAELPKP
jgi:putative hydrolase of the HAD superfamily